MSHRRTARLGGLLSANRIPGRAPALMAMVLVTVAVVLLAGGDPGSAIGQGNRANGSVEPVTVSSTVAGQMTVSWSDPHQITATGFRINYGPSDADFTAWSEEVGNTYATNGTDRSATITGLIGATEYKVRMRAQYEDAQGNPRGGPWGPTQNVTVVASANRVLPAHQTRPLTAEYRQSTSGDSHAVLVATIC